MYLCKQASKTCWERHTACEQVVPESTAAEVSEDQKSGSELDRSNEENGGDHFDFFFFVVERFC